MRAARVASSPPRIGPLPRLPIFLRLRRRPCLVVGGGEVGRWKAEALAACGARVTIIDCAAVKLARGSGIALLRRPFRPSDVRCRALVVAATADRQLNRRVARAARGAGVPINVVDDPDASDVIFPAIVDRDPVVVAVSTGGASPVLARRLRQCIEAALPGGLGAVARFAAAKRAATRAAIPDPAHRRRFWERFFDAVFAGGGADERRAKEIYRRCLRRSDAAPSNVEPCLHVLDPPDHVEDLSLRALRLLNGVDTLVWDGRAAAKVTPCARREARHIVVGDGATLGRAMEEAAADALRGRRVIWLRSPRRSSKAESARFARRFAARGIEVRYVRSADSRFQN